MAGGKVFFQGSADGHVAENTIRVQGRLGESNVSGAFIGLMAMLAGAAAVSGPRAVTVDQLGQALAHDAGKPDAEIAAELAGVRLTERMGAAQLSEMSAGLPGERSKEELRILADSAAWLNPPEAPTAAKAAPPRPEDLHQMLALLVKYVNTMQHQLPNFLATRSTTAFEDRPQTDEVDQMGTRSLGYLPMRQVGWSSSAVAYVDGSETVLIKKTVTRGEGVHGLQTAGEFGPFQRITLADAIKGRMTWARWEAGSDGMEAVFEYKVPKGDSHYVVQFCCTSAYVNGPVASRLYFGQPGYHGEIAFEPSSGTIHRITLMADQPPGELVEKAAMVVEYGPAQIAGKTVILPLRSIALLGAHATPPAEGMHLASDLGPVKTYLNETLFEDYHQFRGEMRILPGMVLEEK